mgnify:FL=1
MPRFAAPLACHPVHGQGRWWSPVGKDIVGRVGADVCGAQDKPHALFLMRTMSGHPCVCDPAFGGMPVFGDGSRGRTGAGGEWVSCGCESAGMVLCVWPYRGGGWAKGLAVAHVLSSSWGVCRLLVRLRVLSPMASGGQRFYFTANIIKIF